MKLLKTTIEKIKPIDPKWRQAAAERLDSLTKPPGSLGRLEEFAGRLVAIAGDPMPEITRKVIFTFAGDHGVIEEGVSVYPGEVTAQMVRNFLRGGAAINVLARHAGAKVVVVDMGVRHDFGKIKGLVSAKVVSGTGNFTRGPAMTRAEAIRSIEAGIRLAARFAKNDAKNGSGKSKSLFGTGDMGIGNTTPSSAIAAVLTGSEVARVTGRGTGISDEALGRKIEAIEKAIRVNAPDAGDPVDVLSKVGGAEIGGIAGLVLGAAANRVPVVIDGFISTAGALIAHALQPWTSDYMFASHKSVETGHRAMLERMGLVPILDLDLRLGEGTGAALAMGLITAGLKIYREMATFGEAGVSDEVLN
ncbi:MAG: nicotinate-nucleotide--dimethylbenzimidazole phosphoribosyltransferase [Nitrospiraceae bacterium]|nr:nicotinate-nucleotide--dimethylbenzimidazole phosphoribosyltransferase [Nitrospiraceae bacterium]